MKDRDVRFHEEWLGLAQPIEGLVFSVPVLADAQIAPEIRPELSAQFESHVTNGENGVPRLHSTPQLFREFLGYDQAGMLVPRDELPAELSFYAPEGGQEIRPSFALGRGPFEAEDPFAVFEGSSTRTRTQTNTNTGSASEKYFALAWNLQEHGVGIDLDQPEATTGPWRYPPTAKFERLLRHVGIPIGILSNGESVRLIYAPSGETTGHLTFRVKDLRESAGRPVLAAMDLLLHARRAYQAAPQFTLEGLLAESRRRQADVTLELAKQVFEAVELLVAGFEAAAARDCTGNRLDWLRPALEAEGDHFYQGVLSVVLRLVFLLYAEDQGLLPVEHPMYAQHLSLFGLYERLSHDAGAHPESMHHRFGAYGQLLALFRAVFFGVRHGGLVLPPRRGKLFDPNAYPFLEGGQPEWTAAVVSPEARAQALPPSIDDGTVYRILHQLVVFEGQRLSYRALDVEQIGSVYESLMGYHVLRLNSPAVRIGKHGVWVEAEAVRAMSPTDRGKLFKETCGLNPGPALALEKEITTEARRHGEEGGLTSPAVHDAPTRASGSSRSARAGSTPSQKQSSSLPSVPPCLRGESPVVTALESYATGKKSELLRHKAAAGRLVVQPGEERRRTGSHYTPRSLTEKVVKRTLEPLLACIGENRTAEQMLELKICDPAMGSGAFLVAACRELAGEIVQAWTRSGELPAILEQHGDAHLHARRLVAQKCLYGVDKNPAAVELAKLSLWLITLSKTLPFTFVDHALRHGDSLVGFDFEQIRAFHWKPQNQLELCEVTLREALEQAVELRQRILALADKEDPASQEEKRRLLDFSQQAIGRVRLVADVCVGAFFAESKDAAREKERNRRLGLVEAWLGGDEAKRAELEDLAREIRKSVSPFHWWIEFPEVFFEERPDPLQGGAVNGAALMEAVVGNPPFGGKEAVVNSVGPIYPDWLRSAFPGDRGVRGSCDLSAFFFRRAANLLGDHGAFGLIATNTIAQGDTRSIGLQQLVVQERWTLFDAVDSMPWPGAAAVVVSLVHGAHGEVTCHVECRLNERVVPSINTRLKPKPERSDPTPLAANKGSAFQGCILLGQGFILTPDERSMLVGKSRRNAQCTFPYIGGEEVNTDPTQSFQRYTINFGRMELEEAEKWPDLMQIVRDRVKPERDKQKGENSTSIMRKRLWWRFDGTRPELYAAISPLERCLVNSQVSKHLVFVFQPTDRVFAHTLYAYPLDANTHFAVLQSRIHAPWAYLLSSSMKTDIRYLASDCFETFPFPKPDPRSIIPELEAIGEKLYEARAKYMVDTDQGLTKTYNAIKDPSCTDPRILELRGLHEQMDRAVLDAYGWTDVAVPPYCPLSDADREAVQAFEDEVIDRLYVLNAERAREEELLGKADAAKGGGKKGGKRGKKAPEGQGGLF